MLAMAATSAAQAKPPSGDVLRIDIAASIGQRCGIVATGANAYDGGRVDEATRVAFAFSLDCNTPFKIGVAAQNGALQLIGSNAASQPKNAFSVRKPYVAGLRFDTDLAGMISAGECASAALLASDASCAFYGTEPGSGLHSGRRNTAIGRQGELTVSWQGADAESVRLAAGSYQEILTIVVAPST